MLAIFIWRGRLLHRAIVNDGFLMALFEFMLWVFGVDVKVELVDVAALFWLLVAIIISS